METSKMKNMVVLKNLPSNMIEEAIVIFKEKAELSVGCLHYRAMIVTLSCRDSDTILLL